MSEILTTEFGRLPVDVVLHIERLAGGDLRMENAVLAFIWDRWHAWNLLYVPPAAAQQIIQRPGDFLRACRLYAEPEFFL